MMNTATSCRALRILPYVALAFAYLYTQPASGQNLSGQSSGGLPTHAAVPLHKVSQTDRVVSGSSSLATLPGHLPGWANTANLSPTPVNASSLLRLMVLLRRSTSAQAAFDQLNVDQHNPSSPHFHQAVSPQEQGDLYGPTNHDIAAIKNWAQSEGLTVGALSPDRSILEIRGTLGTVESALRLHFSNYSMSFGIRASPDEEPQIPQSLMPVIAAIGGLTPEDAQPMFTGSKGNYFLTPADFAIIYDLNPVYEAGDTGATVGGKPQHIAILSQTDAALTDIQAYFAGIGSYQPAFNTFFASSGSDPGTVGSEPELDIERVLGTAPGAIVDLVVGNSGPMTSLYDAASYAVNTLHDPVITMSYGNCEYNLGAANELLWSTLWSAAATNMTSVFVSGGDAGADQCDTHGSPTPSNPTMRMPQGQYVNGFASTAYNVAVGGTEFNDTANPGQYWSSTNDPNTKASALGYIPESAWNDPVSTDASGNVTYLVRAGGGGTSMFNARPSWQVGLGVPTGTYRTMPDIAFVASSLHDQYYVCQVAKCTVTGQSNPATFVAFGSSGTSASSPSMAAIAALLNTAAGSPQGNLAPLLYRLAASPATSQIFHDVTLASSDVNSCDLTIPSTCNNSTPGPNSLQGGVVGFAVGPGYDEATGLGSLDVANFIKAAIPPATSVQLTLSGTALALAQSTTITATVTAQAQSLAAPTGTIQFYSDGVALGSPVVLNGNTAISPPTSFSARGTYVITGRYSGDALYLPSTSAPSTVYVAAQVPGLTVSVSPSNISFVSGATSGNSAPVAISGTNDFAGNVALACIISSTAAANQPSCSIAPAAVALGLNGSSNGVVSIASTTAHAFLTPPSTKAKQRSVFVAGIGIFGVLLAFGKRKRQSRFFGACLLFVLTGGLLAVAGCSSGSSVPLRSSAGTYTVTITATGMAAGALAPSSTSTTLSVNIL